MKKFDKIEDTYEYIKNLIKEDGSIRFTSNSDYSNIYSTCFGIEALSLTKRLSSLVSDKTIKYIQKFQDNEGYFIDASCVLKSESNHTKEYINFQMTDFAQMSLFLLNERPLRKYSFLDKFKNQEYLENYFKSLDWKDPWLTSNIVMFIMNFFIYDEYFWSTDNNKYVEYILEWLDLNQSKKNGLWNFGTKINSINQMAAAYHFLFFYTYKGKQINHLEKIINNTLLTQNYDGLFSYQGGGGSCEDLDAVDILCRGTFYTNFKSAEIINSLKKSYIALIKNQNPDGGFCWAKRDEFSIRKILNIFDVKILKLSLVDYIFSVRSILENQFKVLFKRDKLVWSYSGIRNMKIQLSDSDIWSTWFRLLTIAIIEKTFKKEIFEGHINDWNFKSLPGLGYYNN